MRPIRRKKSLCGRRPYVDHGGIGDVRTALHFVRQWCPRSGWIGTLSSWFRVGGDHTVKDWKVFARALTFLGDGFLEAAGFVLSDVAGPEVTIVGLEGLQESTDFYSGMVSLEWRDGSFVITVQDGS
ncbi:unnamed protein product [Calypogeia fissa]